MSTRDTALASLARVVAVSVERQRGGRWQPSALPGTGDEVIGAPGAATGQVGLDPHRHDVDTAIRIDHDGFHARGTSYAACGVTGSSGGTGSPCSAYGRYRSSSNSCVSERLYQLPAFTAEQVSG
jgi:hypothetical protein